MRARELWIGVILPREGASVDLTDTQWELVEPLIPKPRIAP